MVGCILIRAIIESLLCAQCRAGSSISGSFSPQSCPGDVVVPFHKWETWGSRRVCHLLRLHSHCRILTGSQKSRPSVLSQRNCWPLKLTATPSSALLTWSWSTPRRPFRVGGEWGGKDAGVTGYGECMCCTETVSWESTPELRCEFNLVQIQPDALFALSSKIFSDLCPQHVPSQDWIIRHAVLTCSP